MFVEAHPELVVKDRFTCDNGTMAKDADGRGFLMTAEPGKRDAHVTVGMPPFEYGRRYRVSWFLKTEDVKINDPWSGHLATIRCGNDAKDRLNVPRSGAVLGTRDWTHCAVEFTPAENVKAAGSIREPLHFYNWRATGKVWVRDVVVEEL